MAREACLTLIKEGNEAKILSAVPQLVVPLRQALNTRDPETVVGPRGIDANNAYITAEQVNTLHVLQLLAKTSPMVGEALVPYYRHLLPIMSIFKPKKRNTWNVIDYAQRKEDWRNLGTVYPQQTSVPPCC